MATKKQLESLLNEWGAFEDPVDCEDEADFLACIRAALDELGLCNGCRWYFSAERSCEKATAGYGTCMNRLYKKLLEMKTGDRNGVERKGKGELKDGH